MLKESICAAPGQPTPSRAGICLFKICSSAIAIALEEMSWGCDNAQATV
jgi:hypothetical protein